MKRKLPRLTSLKLQGFKSIPYKHPMELTFGDINILLGANGSGKSNILSFFNMLGFMMKGKLQRYIAETGSSNKFLFYGVKTTPEMTAALTLDVDDKTFFYSFSLKGAVSDRLIISQEDIQKIYWEKQIKNIHTTGLTLDYSESALLKSNYNNNDSVEIVKHLLEQCKVFRFSDSSQSSPMRQNSMVNSAHYLQSEGNNLAAFLYFLKNNYLESYRRITEYAREVVPQFHEFYLQPENGYISLKWEDTSVNDYVLTADQFSDGSIRFIALATLLLQPAETMPFLIIIDEPELGLHPYAIDQLNEMIKDASKHAQIIVSTQSTAIVDCFSADDVTVIERDEVLNGTYAKKLKEEDFLDWLEEYSLSELWNKNIIGGRPA